MRLVDILTKKKNREEKFCQRCSKKTKLEFMHKRPYSKIKVFYCPECRCKFEFGDQKRITEDIIVNPKGTALFFVDGGDDSYHFFDQVSVFCKKWKYILICINTSGESKIKDDFCAYWIKFIDLDQNELLDRITKIITDYKVNILFLPRRRSVREKNSIYKKEILRSLYFSKLYDTLRLDIVYNV